MPLPSPADHAVPFHDRYPIPTRMYREYLVDRLLRRLELPERPRVLDIGCGSGGFLVKLAGEGYGGWGVDLDRTAVEITRGRLSEFDGMEVHQMDFMDVEGPRFDLIFAFSVFEHIEDDVAGFSKVKSLLGDGGRFIFSVPGRKDLFGEVDIAYGHFRRYEKQELLEKLSAAGLAVERFWSWGPAIFSKIYRRFAKNRSSRPGETPADRTRLSGHQPPLGAGFIRVLHPVYSRLLWVLKLQNLFLERDFLNCNYLVTAT